MSANDLTYQIGATLVAIPVGATATQFLPGRGVLSMQIKYASGGTLGFVQSQGATLAQGYILGATEVVQINGPATFFMAANGSTSVAAVLFNYSAGFSLTP